MTARTFTTAVELRRAIVDGRISEMALEAITQIPTETLRAFLTGSGEGTHGGATSLQPLSADEVTRLSVLASQILQGFDIGDDERLQAILEGLTTQFHLTLDNIALLARLDSADLAVALRDPSSLPAARKYALGGSRHPIARANGREIRSRQAGSLAQRISSFTEDAMKSRRRRSTIVTPVSRVLGLRFELLPTTSI